MICARYSEKYDGNRLYEERSSFSTRGYEMEIKKWGLPSLEKPNGEYFCTLYKVEPSPDHPPVMGMMEVYEGGYREWLNPWFDREESDEIYKELKEAALTIINK